MADADEAPEGDDAALGETAASDPPHALEDTVPLGPGEVPLDRKERATALGSIGDYVLEEELGRGGQGSVYRARDRRLQRTVALKLLGASALASEKTRKRFQREAEAASRLDHPGICTIYEFGEHGGEPFIAMQLVPGMPLDRCIRSSVENTGGHLAATKVLETPAHGARADGDSSTSARTRADVDSVLRLIETIARALHVAHQAGLVHRDIKPANIMIRPDARPVILDFGLVQAEDSETQALTRPGDRVGTPAYMSPEQIQLDANLLDRRTDVFSLGVILYQCLTLRRPFSAPTREGLYKAILSEEPRDPRRFNARISSDLRAVVDTALEKDRDRRYQSLAVLADDLAAVRERRPVTVKAISSTGRLWRWSRRNPALAALLAVLTIGLPVLAGLATFIAARQPLVEQAQAAAELRRSEAHLVDGFLAVAEERFDRALESFDLARVRGALVPEAVAGAGFVHSRRESFEDALVLFDRESATVESYSGLRALRAFVEGRLRGELEHVATAQEIEPESPVDFFVLALRDKERALSGDRSAAQSAMEDMGQAVLRSPPRAIYHFELAFLAGEVGDVDTVVAVVEAMTDLWHDTPISHYWAAHALRLCGEWELAHRRVLDGLAVAPHSARLHTELGLIQAAAGELDDALASLERAAQADPDYAEPLYHVGAIHRHRGESELALAALFDAVARQPDHDDAQLTLALALVDLGRAEEADVHFRAAIEIDPIYVPYRQRYAEFLAELGRFAESREQALAIARLDATTAWALAAQARDAALLVTAASLYEELSLEDASWSAAGVLEHLRAARAALSASRGEGADAGLADAQGRARLGELAREWLRASLEDVDRLERDPLRDASSPMPNELRAELSAWRAPLREVRWDELSRRVERLLQDDRR